MNEQELIDALNKTEAERATWKTVALTARNEVAKLKAQVNCLREGLSLALVKIADDDDNDIEFMDVYKYLNTTPEQCLAEVKAKAIEEYKQEQAAESKQIDLATKIMTVTI